ncbi:hypothetical protein [Anaerostipes sp.]|uniref:hypothetical protein n=1 Tax=Anaerostipes sp. TaxID=1872530 RepID=UPI0025BFB27B|nr:hypothetical protein [Anaerostipes sp.]MBS7009169.1 hypothetical protein [Anaerostipes sp.]
MPETKEPKTEVVPEQEGSVTTAAGTEVSIPVRINAGVKFTLLKNHFVAALEKDGDVMMLLLSPTDSAGQEGMTVQEMVEEVKKLMGAKDDDPEIKSMETQLNSTVSGMSDPDKTKGGFDPMSIRIYVQQAFLYYRSAKKEDGTKEKELEYAFSLKADTSKLLGKMDLFTLDEIYFSVWKTNRKKVTDSMNMFMIEDFLKETAQA